MSDSPEDKRAELAAAFEQEVDPLAEYEATFERIDVDPFGLFRTEVLDNRDITDRTKRAYEMLFDQWRTHMDQAERHPACPNEQHVKSFVHYLRTERENNPNTIKEKLRKLDDVYAYWQADPTFPHPQEYDPVRLGKTKVMLPERQTKEPPKMSIEDLRTVLSDVTNIRNRAIILTQLKLGLRATELCNIRLSEITLRSAVLQDAYDELGSHRTLDGRSNTVYIPHDRAGNKSRRPRLLPLDDELRRALTRYLMVRPDNGQPWLFLSLNTHEQSNKQMVNGVWKDAFHPEYAETEDRRAITSHFGRHFFTTFWRVKQDLNSELVKYMRGDTPGGAQLEDQRAMLNYVHTYYEDIREQYLKNIFRFNL